MLMRLIFAAVVSLLLGGCQGWMAETRLIPVSERDPIGLDGTYVADGQVADGQKVTIASGPYGFVVSTSKKSDPPRQEFAFDFLREETNRLHSDPEPAIEEGEIPPAPDRTYLMESPIASDKGITGYQYSLVRISRSPDGTEATLSLFPVRCPGATQAFALRREGDWCVFDDYHRLRAAAFDALAWYDEARMSVEVSKIDLTRKRTRR
ncbi:hypothetical protein ACLBKU_13115 [Erythrobacter sp. NE805]|uniref:hypothetical protein n=1 Tax=Erythrobacter sp. NE805 TaxID=3389875 RepID=UPI00396B0DC1